MPTQKLPLVPPWVVRLSSTALLPCAPSHLGGGGATLCPLQSLLLRAQRAVRLGGRRRQLCGVVGGAGRRRARRICTAQA